MYIVSILVVTALFVYKLHGSIKSIKEFADINDKKWISMMKVKKS